MNPLIPHHKVQCSSSISESEVQVSITIFVSNVHPVQIKNWLKYVAVNKVANMKNTMVVVVLNWSIHCLSLSAIFDSLHSSMNQELFEKHICSKSCHYEKYRRFCITQRKPSHATTKLMLFTLRIDEWNRKEDTGKSSKNALHLMSYA